MRRARVPGWLSAILIALPLACGDMRQDELDCEEAVSHLQYCCPGLTASNIECVDDSGCGSPTSPAISIGQSRCIRDEDCRTLVRSGVCERADAVPPGTHGRSPTDDPASVCP